MFPLSSSFSTGTNNRAILFPPNSSDDIRFRLFASAGSDTDNEFSDQRVYFLINLCMEILVKVVVLLNQT